MPDGEKINKKEEIKFCAKQFFLNDPPKLREEDTLLFRRDINYLVAFKRLQGTYDVYNKMVSKFLKHEDMTEIIDFEQMEVDFSSNQDDDDEKAGDDQ